MRTASSRRRVAIGGKRLAAPATPTPAAMSQARRHEELLRASLPQAEIAVADVNARIEVVALAVRSKKDVHVAACAHAIVSGQHYPRIKTVSLVTKNIRDFGVRKLAE